MTDRRIPPTVPTAILEAAERAIAEASTDDPATELTLREALRAALAIALPMYELRLGMELDSVTFPCLRHKRPSFDPDCIRCARYAALLGARRVIEGRGDHTRTRRASLQETDDGTG